MDRSLIWRLAGAKEPSQYQSRAESADNILNPTASRLLRRNHEWAKMH